MASAIISFTDGVSEEQCGLVYGSLVLRVTNVHSDPENFFTMDPDEQLAWWSLHGKPHAIWHSHPNGDPKPSEADVLGAPPGIPYLIAAKRVVYQYEA